MKIFAVTSLSETAIDYYLIADSALTPWRKPLFLPEWDDDFRLYFSPAIHINRLGKGIPRRFAHRYYNQASWGWTMRANHLYAELAAQGRPVSAAVSFDYAAFIGPKSDFDSIDGEISRGVAITVNGVHQADICTDTLAGLCDSIIENLSRHDTLKTGDIIYPMVPTLGIQINEGDRVEILDSSAKPIHNFTVK